MSMTLSEAINELYDGIFPDYIDEENTDEDALAVYIDSAMVFQGTARPIKITIEDIVDFYTDRGESSVSTLAGIVGEYRMINALAQEAFDWFKCVNREALTQQLDKRGMVIDPRGD